MLNPIVSIIVYLCEMLISYIFYSNIFEKRYPSGKCIIIGCLLFGAGSAINILCANNGVINSVVSIILNCLFAFICFESQVFLSFFYSFILVIINGALEVTVISSISRLTDNSFLDYNSSLPLLVLECSTCKGLYFLVVLIISRIVKPGVNANSLPFNLFLYPLSATACQIIFWYISTQSETSRSIQNLLAIAGMFLFVTTVLLFITYQYQVKKDYETMLMRSEFTRLQTEKTYYQILEQQNQQLMIYAHDTKKHLSAIQALNTSPAIESYITKLLDQLKSYTSNCHSGNMMLDVMINKYVLDCERRAIRFDYYVRSCNLKDIDDIDLVAILGNLMDNAVTAAEASDDRSISLETTSRNGYSVIVISNSCDTVPNTHSGHLVTAKEDTKLHGYGLKSVSKTLKKYNGDFSWDYNDLEHTFVVTAMIGKAKQFIQQ